MRPNPTAAWQLGKVWRFGGPCVTGPEACCHLICLGFGCDNCGLQCNCDDPDGDGCCTCMCEWGGECSGNGTGFVICCFPTFGRAQCDNVSADQDCADGSVAGENPTWEGGQSQGPDTDCGDISCDDTPIPTGACIYAYPDPRFCQITTERYCRKQHGDWQGPDTEC